MIVRSSVQQYTKASDDLKDSQVKFLVPWRVDIFSDCFGLKLCVAQPYYAVGIDWFYWKHVWKNSIKQTK